jgi:hypothetical protein
MTVIGMKLRFLLILYIILGMFLVLNAYIANAVSRTIHVEAGKKETESIHLTVDSVVSGKLSVIGESENEIDFYVSDPDGKIILPKERVSVKNFRFKAAKDGTYVLHFDNTFSAESKTVTYNYDYRRYIFGMPQEDFLVFLIMIVATIGLILFVAVSRP